MGLPLFHVADVDDVDHLLFFFLDLAVDHGPLPPLQVRVQVDRRYHVCPLVSFSGLHDFINIFFDLVDIPEGPGWSLGLPVFFLVSDAAGEDIVHLFCLDVREVVLLLAAVDRSREI